MFKSYEKIYLEAMYKPFSFIIYLLLSIFTFGFAPCIKAQNWDIDLLKKINPNNPSSDVWRTFSSSSYPISIGVPAGLLVAGWTTHNKVLQRKGWEIVGALALNTVLTQGLKSAVNRNRPYYTYPQFIHPDAIEQYQSFPAGHVSTTFTLAAMVSRQFPKWYVIVPAYGWASCIAYSRLYLGEHYPSDVLAGAALGIGSAYLSRWLERKYFKKVIPFLINY